MGTQRCSVTTDRTDLATEATLRWSRSSVARHTSSPQRYFVGLGDGGTVARAAQEVSAVPDLPSSFPAVGAGGQVGTHLAYLGGEAAGPRKAATGGGLHRRILHGGKKGALAVGPTKRGKGTKIIALADDHSLPLAVSIESASPHESQLVEGLLGHSFLDTLPPRLIGDKAYDSDRLDRDLAER
jgi:Transposase DDE domain